MELLNRELKRENLLVVVLSVETVVGCSDEDTLMFLVPELNNNSVREISCRSAPDVSVDVDITVDLSVALTEVSDLLVVVADVVVSGEVALDVVAVTVGDDPIWVLLFWSVAPLAAPRSKSRPNRERPDVVGSTVVVGASDVDGSSGTLWMKKGIVIFGMVTGELVVLVLVVSVEASCSVKMLLSFLGFPGWNSVESEQRQGQS